MAVATICHSKYPSKLPQLHISTNPTDINPFNLSQLYTQCNHSTHRFPTISPSTGKVEPLQLDKLRKAISHSSIVVSVFAKHDQEDYGGIKNMGVGGGWVRNMIPVTPQNGRLVGFGRVVSDFGLTASIYDVMVIPYLQRRGIGRMIVQRILRILIRRDVYDIAALCSDKERPFFKACAFGDDALGSTTMMYSRASPTDSEENRVVAAVCLVSARGLQRRSSLWKLQWFAVGWIDPANKFRSNIDSSGNDNPLRRTKFSAMIDTSECRFEELVLHVEVHSREPIFLRTKLLGTVSVLLKEFVDKYMKDSEVVKPIEEVGSFQLRANNSNKPQGFIDISIRIAPEREEPSSKPGDHEGFNIDSRVEITLPNQYRHRQSYQPQRPVTPFERHEDHSETSSHYSDTASYSSSNSHSSIAESTYGPPSRPYSTNGIKLHNPCGHRQSYPSQSPITLSHRAESHSQTSKEYGKPAPYSSSSYSSSIDEPTYGLPGGLHNQPPISLPIPPPPPPPLPTNVGYIPTFLPRTEHMTPSYMSMRSSGAAHGHGTQQEIA